MNPGDRREPIFRDDLDHKRFLITLADVCKKTDWQIHAYCLMGNHFHLVVETPNPNLVAGIKWFLSTYTARFNRRHKLFGHLFSGRYKALIVDGRSNGYLRTVCDYASQSHARQVAESPNEQLGISRGAVGLTISKHQSNAPAGCVWIGCSVNLASPKTAQPDASSWSNIRRRAGRKRRVMNSKLSDAAGWQIHGYIQSHTIVRQSAGRRLG